MLFQFDSELITYALNIIVILSSQEKIYFVIMQTKNGSFMLQGIYQLFEL